MESQLTVRLPGELHERLGRLAKRLGRKRSEVARLAIQRYLDEAERPALPRAYEQVQDLLGCLDSGLPDLGSRQRDYLLARFRRRA